MEVDIHLIDQQCLPEYQTKGAAGMDIKAANAHAISPGEVVIVKAGFSMALPEGLELQIRSRSSKAKAGLVVLNSPGTVDSDYRGEVGVLLKNVSKDTIFIHRYERIAQGVLAPVIRGELNCVDELPETERGSGGFGHTG